VTASRFRFHPAAEAELDEAAQWYDERQRGLGFEFLSTVRAKLTSLLQAPERWSLVHGTRRVLLGRFPYAIVYRQVSEDELEIVAVAHYRRRPKYWARR
jgi:plasmid stabilization system protein ParE